MSKDMGPLPKIHPRHKLTETAKRELDQFLFDWQQKHKLTLSEEYALIANYLSMGLYRCVAIERRKE